MEKLGSDSGWEYKANLSALSKKFIHPERGRKKNAWLWQVLRDLFYDRVAQNELDLLEPEDVASNIEIDIDKVGTVVGIAPPEKPREQEEDGPPRADWETGSASTAVSNTDVVLRDVSMLQHILLRIIALEVVPTFLSSPEYAKVREELLTSTTPLPIYEALEVEFESLRSTFPQTSEQWLGLLLSAVKYLPQAIIVCDASLPGLPIVGVNVGFEALTGYKLADCIGKNCSFLQGAETEKDSIAEIGEAIRAQRACHVTLLNYKASGEKFLNFLGLTPILDFDGFCHYYVGTITEVLERFTGIK